METKIKVFKYSKLPVRTMSIDNEPWWVLTDVCDVLGLSNPSIVASRLEEDERSKLDLGRQGESWVINEPGLYEVIIRSDKPEAKEFRRWITHDVIPQIRLKGFYGQITVDEALRCLKRNHVKMEDIRLRMTGNSEIVTESKLELENKDLIKYRFSCADVAIQCKCTVEEVKEWAHDNKFSKDKKYCKYFRGELRFTDNGRARMFSTLFKYGCEL